MNWILAATPPYPGPIRVYDNRGPCWPARMRAVADLNDPSGGFFRICEFVRSKPMRTLAHPENWPVSKL